MTVSFVQPSLRFAFQYLKGEYSKLILYFQVRALRKCKWAKLERTVEGSMHVRTVTADHLPNSQPLEAEAYCIKT